VAHESRVRGRKDEICIQLKRCAKERAHRAYKSGGTRSLTTVPRIGGLFTLEPDVSKHSEYSHNIEGGPLNGHPNGLSICDLARKARKRKLAH
jgi:hypothetical protein